VSTDAAFGIASVVILLLLGFAFTGGLILIVLTLLKWGFEGIVRWIKAI
jgi:hypothetical protein